MSLANLPVTGPFRSKNGLLLGVIQGFAEHWRMSPFVLRAMVILLAIFTAFWPVVIVYLVSAFILPARPANLPLTERQKEIVLLSRANPEAVFEGLENRLKGLDAKVRRLEDIVTSKSFQASRSF